MRDSQIEVAMTLTGTVISGGDNQTNGRRTEGQSDSSIVNKALYTRVILALVIVRERHSKRKSFYETGTLGDNQISGRRDSTRQSH